MQLHFIFIKAYINLFQKLHLQSHISIGHNKITSFVNVTFTCLLTHNLQNTQK